MGSPHYCYFIFACQHLFPRNELPQHLSCTLLRVSKAPLFGWTFNPLTPTLPLPFFLLFHRFSIRITNRGSLHAEVFQPQWQTRTAGAEQGSLFLPTPTLHVPGIVYKAENSTHSPTTNIQPPPVFIQEFQISSSKVTGSNCLWFCHNYVFLKQKLKDFGQLQS